eukprot:CAMPEP_0197923782 /NCGR_PEP_ID=MMETSP1439-20131203/94591_1 /TAXON_ID=66791 /ORGANISM="Gonyaulax spinifera, Strain CCMP409" /LENGTH=76 /DNA_ID=CAMNT_0043546171 /DNA_START=18 /DNA_END=244 /DNA_ORIENTATION=-
MALVFHAFTLRPFCTDSLQQVEEGGDDELVPDEATAAHDQKEEVKLMMTCCVLLSAVGSIICLSNGGYVAFKAWLG